MDKLDLIPQNFEFWFKSDFDGVFSPIIYIFRMKFPSCVFQTDLA